MSEAQAKKPNGSVSEMPPPKMEERPKNLVQKLCEVMAAIDRITKRGENKFHNYKYATEADLVEAVRGELSKRNIFIFPNVTHTTRTVLQRSSRDGIKETGLTDIMVTWTFVDGDSGEERACEMPGCGEDSGDKGVYKALTGSEKYLLMKAFLIPTGDDPEKDDGRGSREAAQAVAKQKLKDFDAAKRAREQAQPGGLEKALKDSVPVGKTVAIAHSEKFNGHYVAVSGALDSERAQNFLTDVAAQRFKDRESNLVYWRVPMEYLKSFKEMCAQLELQVTES